MEDLFEVYALRYGSRPECQQSEIFYRYDLYCEADIAKGMDYFFWLIRNGEKNILVDCGYHPERGLYRERRVVTPPAELLSRLGTDVASIDHVVLSHMHFDHVGNTDIFPNATFSMARAEFEYWTGAYGRKPAIGWTVDFADLEQTESLNRAGRLHLVEDSEELFPGIRVTTLPGHTPGQLITEVSTEAGKVVLASDAAHYYDELLLDRPFYLYTSLEEMYRSYEILRDIDARPDSVVVPGHDPLVMHRFRTVAEDCVDLTAQLVAEGTELQSCSGAANNAVTSGLK